MFKAFKAMGLRVIASEVMEENEMMIVQPATSQEDARWQFLVKPFDITVGVKNAKEQT